jgi:hypothetical protein
MISLKKDDINLSFKSRNPYVAMVSAELSLIYPEIHPPKMNDFIKKDDIKLSFKSRNPYVAMVSAE